MLNRAVDASKWSRGAEAKFPAGASFRTGPTTSRSYRVELLAVEYAGAPAQPAPRVRSRLLMINCRAVTRRLHSQSITVDPCCCQCHMFSLWFPLAGADVNYQERPLSMLSTNIKALFSTYAPWRLRGRRSRQYWAL
jgi:hypothetical protein